MRPDSILLALMHGQICPCVQFRGLEGDEVGVLAGG